MATRTINSAGVQIFERDLSLIAPRNVGTNIFIAGFSSQGPTDEVLSISSKDELEAVYGIPTNSAERYFYHGVKELINSPANIYTYRLPYGSGAGVGYGSEYSALVYPVLTYNPSLSAITTNLNVTSGLSATYALGAPVQFKLSEDQYNSAQQGTLFTWSQSGCAQANLSAHSEIGKAGLIVLNKAQTTINSQFEGYYVGVSDNTNINPASNYNAIIGAKTVSTASSITGLNEGTSFTTIPTGTLQFNLSSGPFGGGSVSQVMENLTSYNIDGRNDDDLLNIGVFKLRKSLFATESYKLDYVLDSAIVGSIDQFRTQLNPTGGPSISFFLENADTNSRNVEILVNPYISNKFTDTAVGPDGIPRKKVRMITNELVSNNDATKSGIPNASLSTLASRLGYADNLYPIGTFSDATLTAKDLGAIPSKIERALDAVKNDEIYDIDVVVEAGLGTIYTMSKAAGTTYYDASLYTSGLSETLQTLRTSQALGPAGENLRGDYQSIFGVFENFCNLPSNTGGRGDCMLIADPIRQIMIVGKNTKVLSDRSKNFTTDIYWAMRHQFELANTSYAAVYGNWAQTYDEFMGDKIWVPFSSVAAAAFARNDAAEFPWSAPAGYTRGLVGGNTVNLAITPNQKQRDDMYKTNINPVLFSPAQGMAIFGQKTLSRKPSAFDRINVRRCLFALERPTKKAALYFVFEPNNTFTQTRFKNTLEPIFNYAKQNGGVYDYEIICDERVNTPDVIDNNELKALIMVKPTRTAEYVLVEFAVTRTDFTFSEVFG